MKAVSTSSGDGGTSHVPAIGVSDNPKPGRLLVGRAWTLSDCYKPLCFLRHLPDEALYRRTPASRRDTARLAYCTSSVRFHGDLNAFVRTCPEP
ncbi:hypothetical protein BAUCODRAFT_30280 [Baudoinia panamericana UAMH 10762]|uniref:Uncharacterized protein n=1 Tax=Baudoinia panamericana (strain UAMH 10762) TaxID=717646 RepID=M2NKA5_BAUPA|nr:uncharacterized protein BAUCODRAFT_30280 [Baudoinia panamericana UAMH 10762]EMC99869.1 hypothetical protein BAUCODRAFT_30280 [Baudoinia panamericana UAMH 10762]